MEAQHLKNKLNSKLKFLNKLHSGSRQAKIFAIAIKEKIFSLWIRFWNLKSLRLAVNFQEEFGIYHSSK